MVVVVVVVCFKRRTGHKDCGQGLQHVLLLLLQGNLISKIQTLAAVSSFHLEEEGIVKELLLGQVLGVDDGLGGVQGQVVHVVLLLVVRVLQSLVMI